MEGLNVLSLFDGISCGMIALERAGIPVTNYFASEIDKHAIKVSKANWPDIKHIGSVVFVNIEYDVVANTSRIYNWLTGEDFTFQGMIDLIIGGSPCQGFSFAGKQLNFNDPRSALFFEFVRLREESRATYFFLENVKMKKESEDVITETLGIQPHRLNSSLVSAQNRNRLYWSNIIYFGPPQDRGVMLSSLLHTNELLYSDALLSNGHLEWWLKNKDFQLKKKYSSLDSDKAMCLTARMYASWNGNFVTTRDGEVRKLTAKECERLQNLPDNYTNAENTKERYKMLGNGWTVDMIVHLFQPLLIADIL